MRELTARGTEMIGPTDLRPGDTLVRLGGELSIVLSVRRDHFDWFVDLVHHNGDQIVFWTVGPMLRPRFERVL